MPPGLARRRATVLDPVRIESQLTDSFAGRLIVGFIDRAGEDEFGFAFGGIDFHRVSHGRANQDTVLAFFGNDQATFFDSKLAAETGGHDYCAALTDLAGFDGG